MLGRRAWYQNYEKNIGFSRNELENSVSERKLLTLFAYY